MKMGKIIKKTKKVQIKKMKRREKVLRCKCPCNRELPSRYKGRQKIFYDSPVCRKIWHSFTEEEQQARLKEMEEATS